MPQAAKVPITMRALIQRINRKVAPDDLVLKAARGVQTQLDVGQFYVLNTRVNGICYWGKDISPEAYRRELGVLKPWETVVADA
jgi:hypothetical protein